MTTESPFNKLALAITFSPNSPALLQEAKRLKEVLRSGLVLIHVGNRTSELEKQLNEIIQNASLGDASVKLIWEKGGPANVVIKKCKEENVDLLLIGALEKETMIKYYLGSVARTLMRRAPCSVLIFTHPSEQPSVFKKIFVSMDYSSASEATIKIAHALALLEQTRELTLVRDFNVPGLAMTLLESGSMDETETARQKWQEEEKIKLELYARELNLQGVAVNTCTLYGKEGWECAQFAKGQRADLLVLTSPVQKMAFLDRLFTHHQEFVFQRLPTNTLLIRK